MVPHEKMKDDPGLRAVYENEEEYSSYYQLPEESMYFLVTQLDEDESLNCLLLQPALRTSMDAIGKRSVEESRAAPTRLTENFPFNRKKLCELAATLLLWTICCREPLEHRVAKIEQLRLAMPAVRSYLITVKELQPRQKMPPLLEYFSPDVEDLLYET